MSSLRFLIASLVLSSAATVSAQEQAPPEGRSLLSEGIGFGLNYTRYSKINVLRQPRVQDELQLTDAQRRDMKTLEEDLRRSREEYRNRLRTLGDNPDRQVLAELQESQRSADEAASARLEAGLRKLLDRSQATRLEQIHYQTEGPMLFTRPEVQRRLNLSPEQIEQISVIVDQGKRDLAAASRLPAQISSEEARSLTTDQRRAQRDSVVYKDAVKKVQGAAVETRGEVMRSIAKVLTKGQRQTYQKMIGEPFDFTKAWTPPKPETQPKKPDASSS